jgi:hypothetical protein
MGWRYLLFTLGGITLLVFCLRYVVFTFRETPKFLVYKGQDEKAIETLRHMAKVNNTECHLTIESFEILRGEDPSEDSVSSSRYALGGGSKQINVNWTEKAQAELSRYKMLFDGIQMTRLTILTWLTYIFDFWGFTVAGISIFPKLPLKQHQLTRYYQASIYPESWLSRTAKHL